MCGEQHRAYAREELARQLGRREVEGLKHSYGLLYSSRHQSKKSSTASRCNAGPLLHMKKADPEWCDAHHRVSASHCLPSGGGKSETLRAQGVIDASVIDRASRGI